MKFLICKKLTGYSSHYLQVGEYFLQYKRNSDIPARELFFESKDYILIGDVNPSFNNKIYSDTNLQNIEKNINLLNNGYLIFIDKTNNKFYLFTDVFGFYHIFYHEKETEIVISSDFNSIVPFSTKEHDDFAVLDIILFNYTLINRTLLKDIKRFFGGSKVIISNDSVNIDVVNNFANNFNFGEKVKLTHRQFAESIVNSVREEIITTCPNELSMTGGFDSRALLATCTYLNLKVNAFTFGQEGNIEIETINPFIQKFVSNHRFIKLDNDYINSIDKTFESFISKNLDNPVFHSLVEYEHCKHSISGANLLMGFMGGELITGQSIGAQVTFTKFAADLLSTNNKEIIKKLFIEQLTLNDFLDKNYILGIADSYLDTLRIYFLQENNLNVIRFVINEEYSKFFGASNKIFRNNNLVVPFIKVDFLTLLLNSEISFLRKKQFKKNPFANIKAKILYAKAINFLNPDLGSTKFDRLYSVRVLCRFYLLPKAVLFYFLNHFYKKNKKNYTKTTNYEDWYCDLVLSKINLLSSMSKVLSSNYKSDYKEYKTKDDLYKKRIMKATAIYVALEQIEKNQGNIV